MRVNSMCHEEKNNTLEFVGIFFWKREIYFAHIFLKWEQQSEIWYYFFLSFHNCSLVAATTTTVVQSSCSGFLPALWKEHNNLRLVIVRVSCWPWPTFSFQSCNQLSEQKRFDNNIEWLPYTSRFFSWIMGCFPY